MLVKPLPARTSGGCHMGFRVEGLGFRVEGLGFRVWGLGNLEVLPPS